MKWLNRSSNVFWFIQAVCTSSFMKCIFSFLSSMKSHDKSLHTWSILTLSIILMIFIFIDLSFFFWSLESSSHCICKCWRFVKAWFFHFWICAWYSSAYSVRNWQITVLEIRVFSFNKWSLNQQLSSSSWIKTLSKAVALLYKEDSGVVLCACCFWDDLTLRSLPPS